MRDRFAAALVAVPFVLGSLTGPGAGAADGEPLLRFADPAIVEASGLVVLDGLVVTVNDSGDTGRVFTVDAATGETVGVTTWAADPEDVEGLAPAGPRAVWVGDIGDNAGDRTSVTVARVPVGPGPRSVDPATYELVYPDGPRDAESLLAAPDGRLLVATKSVLGGSLYAAPKRLSAQEPNRLRRLGPVLPIATDGAFLPGGEHLVLRDYGRAVVYAWPSLERVAELDLPDQRQGEAIAVAADGTAYVTSEGPAARVLAVTLPELGAPGASPSAPASSPAPSSASSSGPSPPPASREGVEVPETDPGERPAWPWFLTGWLGLGVIVLLMWLLRRRD